MIFIKDDINGYITHQNDANDLADKIEQCINDLKKMDRLQKIWFFTNLKKIPNHKF